MLKVAPTPWINWDEWNFVRDSLFSSSPDSLNTALNRVATWKRRGFLPIVVDVTAAIIETHQVDPKFRKDLKEDRSVPETLLSSSYLTTILRLVNGIIDPYRNRERKRGLSISTVAEELGLPRMLIDIRHEGSHRTLPSLNLLREASVKALEWIKSNYWEPQSKAIPLQRDKIDLITKETTSKLHELAVQLNKRKLENQEGEKREKSQSAEKKRKRSGRTAQGGCIKRGAEYLDSPAQLELDSATKPSRVITGIVRSLFRLYSSHPSEFVDVLLDVLQKALDSLSSNGVEASIDSGPDDPLCEDSESQTGVLDLCKLVITKFLHKEPKLLLIMLRAVLNTLELKVTMYADMRQVDKLSSLVLWIIERYNESGQQVGGDDKVAALEREVLRRCLVMSFPGNNQLARSSFLLAQMVGNSSMIDSVKKLLVLRSASGEDISRQQEASMNEAKEVVELLKRRQNKNKGEVTRKEDRWTIANSWDNLTSIAMLPGSLGSTGVVPVLDRVINVPDTLDPEALKEINDVEEGMAFEDGEADDQDLILDPLKGRLMIGGICRQVHAEELHAIESAVRILV